VEAWALVLEDGLDDNNDKEAAEVLEAWEH
jgi:hypothetical protein